MDSNKLLYFKPNTVNEIRKLYDLDGPGRMEAAVDILKEWVKKQSHFTKHDIPLLYLEITIIVCKGSVERSKLMLDKICTMRTLMPEFFGVYNAKKDFDGLNDYSVSIVLPKPTEDNCRIYLFKIYDSSSMKKHYKNLYRYLTILADYVKLHDYLSKAIVLIDLFDANLGDIISGVDILEFKHHTSVIMEGFGMRPQRIHFLTQSKLIGTFVSFIKSALKPKIGSRIEVNSNYEELQKYIPKEILPMDYGGDESSIREIQDSWLDALSSKEFLEYLREMNEAKTNESLRSRSDFNEHYAGTAGTFKYLNID